MKILVHLMHLQALVLKLLMVHHFHQAILVLILLCVEAVEVWHLLGVVVIESSVWGVKALDPFDV